MCIRDSSPEALNGDRKHLPDKPLVQALSLRGVKVYGMLLHAYSDPVSYTHLKYINAKNTQY